MPVTEWLTAEAVVYRKWERAWNPGPGIDDCPTLFYRSEMAFEFPILHGLRLTRRAGRRASAQRRRDNVPAGMLAERRIAVNEQRHHRILAAISIQGLGTYGR